MVSPSKTTQNKPGENPLSVDDSELEPPEDLALQLRKRAEAENRRRQEAYDAWVQSQIRR